jgi:GTPase SAR1 family protein
MAELGHLSELTRPVMSQSREERLEFLRRDKWVPYPKASEIFQLADDLLAYPKTIRMPSLLIVGDADNGKSSLLKRFSSKLHPPDVMPSGDPFTPVVWVEMPTDPNDSRFWSSVLLSMNILHDVRDSAQSKQAQAYKVLQYIRLKMLMVDEVHNILQAGARDQKVLLGILRAISNRLQIPIVAAGIRDAVRALHTDPQLSSRFDVRVLEKWNLNLAYRKFLKNYEALIPLPEPSNLDSEELAVRIYPKAGGTIGRTVKVLKQAGEIAIKAGKPKIDVEIIDQVQLGSLSDYYKQAEMA